MQNSLLLIFCTYFFIACTPKTQPQSIRANEDLCANCKMQISDIPFACELITKKGKAFLFDDIYCLVTYIEEQHLQDEYQQIFFVNYYQPKEFIPLHKVYLYHAEKLSTPMSGNCIALASLDSLKILDSQYGGKEIVWGDLLH